MHMTVIRTSGHRISPKKYTHVQHKNCESGLAIIYKAYFTQTGPAHTAGYMEIVWTDEAIFLPYATGSPHRCSQKRSESK